MIQGLLEGPTYPTAPVEIDTGFRIPSDPILAAGQLLLTLEEAESSSSIELPIQATTVDNGDPFGEPGDEAASSVRWAPVSPETDEFPGSARFTVLGVFRSNENVTEWRIEFWEPSRPGKEQSYYVDVMLFDAQGEVLGKERLRFVFQVAPGQLLTFANPTVTVPVPTGPETEIRLAFDLNRTAGDVDPAEPIFDLTILSRAVPIPALRPPYGTALLGLLLLAVALAVFARRRATRSDGGSNSL